MDEILDRIKELYKKAVKKNAGLQKILKKVEELEATYADASTFSSLTGQIIGELIDNELKENLLDGVVPQEVAQIIIPGALIHNHEVVSDVCESIQNALNKKAGISIKALRPFFEDRKVDGIVREVLNAPNYPDKSEAVKQQIENVSMSAVDKSVQANAEFHYNSGLQTKITRKSIGECCEWCNNMVGEYDYESVKRTGNEVFRRHSNCRCQVLYVPVKGLAKNLYSKKEKSLKEWERLRNEQEFELEQKQKAEEREAKRELLRRLKSGELTKELNPEKQAPHMEATRTPGRSYFTVDEKTLQRIIDERHGTGVVHIKKNGQIKEIIEMKNNIGYNMSEKQEETNRFVIHYSKKRTHAVPARRNDEWI